VHAEDLQLALQAVFYPFLFAINKSKTAIKSDRRKCTSAFFNNYFLAPEIVVALTHCFDHVVAIA